MKVVSPQQMSNLESLAFRDGSSEIEFMEEAGSGVSLIAHDYAEEHGLSRVIVLLCGKGNNTGDAYVAGIQLMHLEHDVIAYQLFPIDDCSNLCRQNHFQFINSGGHVKDVQTAEEVEFPPNCLIIDGIFGTGFSGNLEEPIISIIQKANSSGCPIISIDIPSGLDGTKGKVESEAIMATITAYLGLPKTGFFLRDGWNHVGKLEYVDFGLGQEYIESAKADLEMLSPDMLRNHLPILIRNRHKYQAGHVVGLAGSLLMPGAALLSSLAALCSGAGIVQLLHPESMTHDLSIVPYELLKLPYQYSDYKYVLEKLNAATATFIGPGLGMSQETRELLKKVIPGLTKPCVLDADALNIIAEEKIPIPKNAILTPHTGEIKKLMDMKSFTLDFPFLKKCQDYSEKNKAILLLKGGPTFILDGVRQIYVNPKGDPGMATAGSGDVLTGLLASLLAQGLTPLDAAQLGVYLHGIAGEHAAVQLTSYCMTASDIITYFPDAFLSDSWTT